MSDTHAPDARTLKDYWGLITTGAVALLAIGGMQVQLALAGEEIDKLETDLTTATTTIQGLQLESLRKENENALILQSIQHNQETIRRDFDAKLDQINANFELLLRQMGD